jgi:cytochrome c oxidase subunit 2
MLSALMPVEASEQAAQTDLLFFILLALAAAILLLVLVLVVTFSIRYRRGSPAPRGKLPEAISREFEIGWTSATFFIAVFLFWWAASGQLGTLAAPPNALEIHVVAKQWMWKTQHANGAREIDELHVPVDTPVRLVMTSQDVIHSFFVPAFRLKQDVLPNRTVQTGFRATKTGVYHLLCAEFCGTDHSRMGGRVVVMEKDAFAQWLSAQPEADTLADEGRALFVSRGCAACHADASRVAAPKLTGVFGSHVKLTDGRTVEADEAYLRDSILQPGRDVVAGYQPIMPSYAGVLSQADVQSLVAYIRTLAAPKSGEPAP